MISKTIGGVFGPGVAQWRPDVLKVLAMLGLPSTLAGRVLFQMQTETGGNPNAINLTDSNAAAGDPSRGLLQTIGATFRRYRSFMLPDNIFDPMANIFAAVNYAMNRYGRTLMRGGMGMGSGHGYDRGGWLHPDGILNFSGKKEAVLTPGQSEAFVSASRAAEQFARRPANQDGARMMRDVYLMLPEGTTVAAAMNELNFHLTHAQMKGFAGVHP